jgi:hypothetical protein
VDKTVRLGSRHPGISDKLPLGRELSIRLAETNLSDGAYPAQVLVFTAHILLTPTQNPDDPRTSHIVAKEIHTHMNRDISVVVAQLALVLRDSETHKQFLACRETEAQSLLDLLQDVSTSLGIKCVFHRV